MHLRRKDLGSEMNARSEQVRYVLVTPARNEAEFVEKTIESVVRQSMLPVKWVVVNDGSTDSTGELWPSTLRSTIGLFW